MLTFFEMYQLLESDNINKVESPLDKFKRLQAEINAKKQSATTEPSPVESPQTPLKPQSQPEKISPLTTPPSLKTSNLPPPPPIKTNAEKEQEAQQAAVQERKPWERPSHISRNAWENQLADRLSGKNEKVFDRDGGFNGALVGSPTSKYYVRLALHELNQKETQVPFQVYKAIFNAEENKFHYVNMNEIAGQKVPPNTIPSEIDRGEKFTLSSKNPRPYKPYETPYNIVILDGKYPANDNLNRLMNVSNRLYEKRNSINWEKTNEGNPITYKDWLLKPAVDNNANLGKSLRAIQFEKVLLDDDIKDRKFTIHGLAAALAQKAGLKGGLQTKDEMEQKTSDEEVLKFMIKTASNANFTFFKVNGDINNLKPETPVMVTDKDYRFQQNPNMGEDKSKDITFGKGAEEYEPINPALLPSKKNNPDQDNPKHGNWRKDLYGSTNLIRNDTFKKKPDEIQPESKQWVDLMTIMEHWGF